MYFILSFVLYAQCQSGNGQGTFYDVHNAAENDGYTSQFSCPVNVPADGMYAAVSSSCFSDGKSICGTVVTVSYNGKSIQVPILDECASCEGNHIDLSKGAFSALESNLEVGIIKGITWSPTSAAAPALNPSAAVVPNSSQQLGSPGNGPQATQPKATRAKSNKTNGRFKQSYSPFRRCRSSRASL